MIALRHRAALALAIAAWPELAAAETSTATVTSSIAETATTAAELEEDTLTTGERAEGEPGAELALAPLKLPELITELALSPLIPVLLSFEKLRLHERLFDLLTNDERTMAIVPVIDAFNRSGFSAGAAFLRNDPLGSADRMIALALYRANRDRLASFSYTRRLRFLSGKRFHFDVAYGVDHDERYYGMGGASRKEDERLMRSDYFDATTWIDIPAPTDWNARIELVYRRRGLRSGEGSSPSLMATDSIGVPPGFDRTLDYPELTATFAYDSRDSESRTSRGFVAALAGTATHDLNGGSTGGFVGTARAGLFVPVLPLYRVLVLTAGASIAAPFGPATEIPYHTLVDLGGSTRLRGYESGRFVDRLGWWGTAEYRYQLFEWAGSGNGLSATLFTDLGRVGRDPGDLLSGPLRWSIGFGVRAEMDLLFLGRFQVAYSPEGVRFVLAVNDLL